MSGAAVGVRDAGHIGMESLLIWVSEELRRKLEIVIHLLSALFGAMMAGAISVPLFTLFGLDGLRLRVQGLVRAPERAPLR